MTVSRIELSFLRVPLVVLYIFGTAFVLAVKPLLKDLAALDLPRLEAVVALSLQPVGRIRVARRNR